MNAATQSLVLAGPAGPIEARLDRPSTQAPLGTAVICHPHPLYGGTMDNKVVQTIARAFVQSGWNAVRFNFRGVGASAGGFDEGRGEAEDLRATIRQVAGEGPLALAGFSFGAFVASCVALDGLGGREPSSIVLVGLAVRRFEVAAVPPGWHRRTLVIHGEQDETVPLADVMDWARPQSLPVTVMPGASHFFHGQLQPLRDLVARHVQPAVVA